MTIKTDSDNGTLTVAINGRLDTATSPDLEKELNEKLEGVTSLIFDLGELTYTSSSGLRVFLKAQKTMNAQGSMKIINTTEDVKEIFDVTGFSDIMDIE